MIQPAQRFPDEIPPNVDALIRAKMEAHPRIRMIVFDYGVRGEYRVRDLEIAAVRTDKIIQGDELDSLPSDLLDTRTSIKERGLNINLDPSKVYYSAKLETERLETTRILLDFKKELNRPLSICDPYCGVGPNLAHILACDGLSSSILANDLNPDCIPFLFENLLPLRSHSIPEKIDGLIQITPDILIGNLDALSIPLDKFIDNALYHPKKGYYMQKLPFGQYGDFITAPGISKIFSEMVFLWLISYWEKFYKDKKINIVELGAGNGEMTSQIIKSAINFKKFYNKCDFIIFEKSNKLIKLQKEKHKNEKVKWLKNLDKLQNKPTIFFGNEFLDALPIKQFVNLKGNWYEKYVQKHKDVFTTKELKEVNHFSYDELTYNSYYKDYKIRNKNDYLKFQSL